MDDPDVIAILTPLTRDVKGENAETAFGQDHNAARYRNQADRLITTESANHSRETRPALLSPVQRSEPSGCLVLRFSDPLINDAAGISFGTNQEQCDILINYQGAQGISGRHFTFVVKEDGSWFLEDFFSTFGTAVGYDGQGRHHRRTKERWIIAHSPAQLKPWTELVVEAGSIAFKIDFPNQEANHPIYKANLEAFIKKCSAALPALRALGLTTHNATTAPSQITSPDRSRQPIYIEYGEVGRGGFATVLEVMSARDGRFYAMKKFYRPSEGKNENKKKRMRGSDEWLESKRKEADIMKQNAHPNVMPLLHVIEEPDAFSIVMPYYNLGGLEDYRPADEIQAYKTIFLQILLVLSWLHSRGVVHRDIKPENILIENNAPLKIIVADFGLSKLSMDRVFTSFKGTLVYCAPEVGRGNSTGYGPKADMWSLGVMMLQLMFGLPHIPSLPSHGNHEKFQEWVDHWSRKLRSEFYSLTGKNAQMASILIDLIQIDPEKRFTADQCLQRGLDINLFRRNEESQIVLQNAEAVDTSTSESWQINSLAGLGGIKKFTMQSPRFKATEANDDLAGLSRLNGELWGGSFDDQRCGNDQAASVKVSSVDLHHDSEPPRRRQKTSNTSERLDSLQGLNVDEKRYVDSNSRNERPRRDRSRVRRETKRGRSTTIASIVQERRRNG